MRRVGQSLVVMAGILILESGAAVLPLAGQFLPAFLANKLANVCLQLLHAGPFLYLSALVVSALRIPDRRIRVLLYLPLLLAFGSLYLRALPLALASLASYVLYLRALARRMERPDLDRRGLLVLVLGLASLPAVWFPTLWFVALVFWVLLISLIVRTALAARS